MGTNAQEGLSGPLPATGETQYPLELGAEDENFARVHSIRLQDPVKKRHKCVHCTYASIYPKDILRHTLRRHPDPNAQVQVFICREPGCTAVYHRKDNLTRHCRKNHPDTRSILSTVSTDTDLIFSTVSTDTSRFDNKQTSSFHDYIDPYLISPSSASNSHSFLGIDP